MTTTTQANHHHAFLIIGYGNELRGDDAVGRWIANAVANWQLPWVKVLSVQQLTPELTDEIAQVSYVIFVDACGKRCVPEPQIDPLVVSKHTSDLYASSLNHTCDPLAIMTLTYRLYGCRPQAWLLQIPTEHCDLGRDFSDTAYCGADRALRTIENFLTHYQRPTEMARNPCMKSA